jgi:4-hydroxy-3-methylbut-2-enyl diphosphate reductase
MEIILAKTAGFCMGVKRAIKIACETAEQCTGKVFTCGPLIHNPQAVEMLRRHGVQNIDDWQSINQGTIIIRAHGMPADQIEAMQNSGLEIVDATCPHVVTSQRQIKKYSRDGFFIVIVGDKKHPEILSLQSFASNNNFVVISDIKEAMLTQLPEKIMVIAQTTYNAKDFEEISQVLKSKSDRIEICNSICLATSKRQKEIMELAEKVDAVIVVGGYKSANTRRLAEIAQKLCKLTFHIETENELEAVKLKNCKTIAVTAGASTPDFITEKVIDTLNNL